MSRLLACLLLPLTAWATDPHEPDDTAALGLAAGTSMHIVGQGPVVIDALVAEAGGEDWISFYSDCCMTTGAMVVFDASLGNVKLRLYDAQGNLVPVSDPNVFTRRGRGWRGIGIRDTGGYFYARVWTEGAVDVPYSVRMLASVYVN